MDNPEIRTFKWYEHPLMRGIKEILEEKFPGWMFSDILCPGKSNHYTFCATKGNEKQIVHVNTMTKELMVENGYS